MKAAFGTSPGSEDLVRTKHECPKAATKCRLQEEVRRRRGGEGRGGEGTCSGQKVPPPWGRAGEAATWEPCQLAGTLRALPGLSPLWLALALQVQPCKLFSLLAKKPRDQAESTSARAVRLPHLPLLTNTKHRISDRPCCPLTPQPSLGQSTQPGEA